MLRAAKMPGNGSTPLGILGLPSSMRCPQPPWKCLGQCSDVSNPAIYSWSTSQGTRKHLQLPEHTEYSSLIRELSALFLAGRGREDGKECWVAFSTPEFACENIKSGSKDPQEAAPQLQEESLRVLGAFSGGNSLPSVASARVQVFVLISVECPTLQDGCT